MAGSIEQYSAGIAIACIIGSALSVYSYYLISRLEEDDEFEALCDLGERLSCTKTLQAEYVYACLIYFLHRSNFICVFFFCTLFAVLLAVLVLWHRYSVATHSSTNPTDCTACYTTQSCHS